MLSNRRSFLLILTVTSQSLVGCKSEEWQSLSFLIPDPSGEYPNRICSLFSRYFCHLAYIVEKRQSYRFPHLQDLDDFARIVNSVYRDHNWFSVSKASQEQEMGECCVDQCEMYKRFGQRFGLSPEAYWAKAANYSSVNRRLNLIRSTYAQNLCVNVVSVVGFGSGPIRLSGGVTNKNYVIPVGQLNDSVIFIPYERLELHLTFDWFKENVICKEQSWICQNFPTLDQSVLP
ncbi:uncharacterized protein LOC142353180 [Convolutriloba macropyga]|uniref:uncharacterized protein LOC142353180 n=1 Tax=Convolutriloba macropyga TaxID=536237 RepID=UPI003F5277C6